jgi:hypothetical protein
MACLGRTLHLVDIENLLWQPPKLVTGDQAVRVFWQYLKVAGWQSGDSVVIASNPALMSRIAFQLEDVPCRKLCAWGESAADQLLLGAVPNNIEARYTRVIVGSGDHIFSALINELSGSKVRTLVIANTGAVSWQLYSGADEVCQLSSPSVTTSYRSAERSLVAA